MAELGRLQQPQKKIQTQRSYVTKMADHLAQGAGGPVPEGRGPPPPNGILRDSPSISLSTVSCVSL